MITILQPSLGSYCDTPGLREYMIFFQRERKLHEDESFKIAD